MTRDLLAAPAATSEPEPGLIEGEALARDVSLLAAGRAFGRLDPPPPPWYRRRLVQGGALGTVLLTAMAFAIREGAKPGTVDYDVTILPPE